MEPRHCTVYGIGGRIFRDDSAIRKSIRSIVRTRVEYFVTREITDRKTTILIPYFFLLVFFFESFDLSRDTIIPADETSGNFCRVVNSFY